MILFPSIVTEEIKQLSFAWFLFYLGMQSRSIQSHKRLLLRTIYRPVRGQLTDARSSASKEKYIHAVSEGTRNHCMTWERLPIPPRSILKKVGDAEIQWREWRKRESGWQTRKGKGVPSHTVTEQESRIPLLELWTKWMSTLHAGILGTEKDDLAVNCECTNWKVLHFFNNSH